MKKMKIENKELVRFLKFVSVGAVGTVVNYTFWIIFEKVFGIPDKIALGFAIEISIISNFILNNIWTFRDRNNKEKNLFKIFKFNIVSLGGLLLNIITYTIFKDYFGMYKYFAEIFGIIVGMFWNFFINNFWTWKK